jgi:hypothetical protein
MFFSAIKNELKTATPQSHDALQQTEGKLLVVGARFTHGFFRKNKMI